MQILVEDLIHKYILVKMITIKDNNVYLSLEDDSMTKFVNLTEKYFDYRMPFWITKNNVLIFKVKETYFNNSKVVKGKECKVDIFFKEYHIQSDVDIKGFYINNIIMSKNQ